MVSKQEDKINFAKLETEVFNAMNADAKYQRENDAKFRAVDQKVATYDEFVDIVKASHLKPLEKDEQVEHVSSRTGHKWNMCAGNNEADIKPKTTPLTQSAKLPKNSMEFGRDWRRFCKSDADKYNFLLRIGGEQLGRIFQAEISLGLLGDFLTALFSCYQEDQMEEIVRILDTLSKVKRFSLSLQFLSANEKDTCANLFTKIEDSLKEKNMSHEPVKNLCALYDVKK